MFHVIQAARVGMIRREPGYSKAREDLAWRISDRLPVEFVPVYLALQRGATEEQIDATVRLNLAGQAVSLDDVMKMATEKNGATK